MPTGWRCVQVLDATSDPVIDRPAATSFRCTWGDAAEDILRSYGAAIRRRRLALVQTWLLLPDGALRELWRPGPHTGEGIRANCCRPSTAPSLNSDQRCPRRNPTGMKGWTPSARMAPCSRSSSAPARMPIATGGTAVDGFRWTQTTSPRCCRYGRRGTTCHPRGRRCSSTLSILRRRDRSPRLGPRTRTGRPVPGQQAMDSDATVSGEAWHRTPTRHALIPSDGGRRSTSARRHHRDMATSM